MSRLVERLSQYVAKSVFPSEARDLQSWAMGEDLTGSMTSAGVTVSPDTSVRLAAVYACVRLLADTVSCMPVDVFRRGDDTREPVDPPGWLVEPNPELTSGELWSQIVVSIVLAGNAFVYVVRDSSREPVELWPLHPSQVQVERRYGSYGPLQYRIVDQAETVQPVRNWVEGEMLHFRGITLPGQTLGLSPIQAAKQTVGLALAAEEYGARFFGQGAIPTIALETDRELKESALRELAEEWRREHSGLRRSHLPAVLQGGLKVRPIGINPDEAQFLETRQYSATEVARLFGVPPSCIGADEGGSLTYNNPEARSRELARYGIQPRTVRIEQTLQRLLRPDLYLKFNMNAFMRPHTRERYEAYTLALRSGFMTVNEVRALEDMPPLPGGDSPNVSDSDNLVSVSGLLS